MFEFISTDVSLGDLFTALSVIVIGYLGIATLRQSEEQKRRENTINVLLDHFETNENDEFAKLLHSDEPSPDGSAVNLIIRNKLNQIEFLCLAMRQKVLDEKLVIEDASYRIHRVYKRFKPYIDGRRRATGTPQLFEHLEWAVTTKICPRWGWDDPTKVSSEQAE
jgi:hypothetical protein